MGQHIGYALATMPPTANFTDLLFSLEQHKNISTEYGLNRSIHQHSDPDRHNYEIEVLNGIETTPGPDWHNYRWIVSQAFEFLPFHTVYLVTDNRDLLANEVRTTRGLSHTTISAPVPWRVEPFQESKTWTSQQLKFVFRLSSRDVDNLDSSMVRKTKHHFMDLINRYNVKGGGKCQMKMP